MKYTYFPGCSLERNAAAYHISTLAVTQALGMELVEVEDWNCCGAAEAEDPRLVYALNARNLAIAEKEKVPSIVTPCSICYYNLARTNNALKQDEKLRAELKALDPALDYNGSVTPKHILEFLMKDVGQEALKSKLTKQVKLKVAPYYGCYLGRPPETAFDDPDDPVLMDQLIALIGGETVPFSSVKTVCCGGPLMMTRADIAFEMARKILETAKKAGADCIALACPLCGMMLDAKQPDIEKALKLSFEMPVVYITQLLGLALGIEPGKLGFQKNVVSTKKILEKVG